MLRLRIISALLGIPMFLAIAWSGGWLFTAGVIVLAALAWREYCALCGSKDLFLWELSGYCLAIVWPIVMYWSGSAQRLPPFDLGSIGIILIAFWMLREYPSKGLTEVALTFWGIFYTIGLMSYLIAMRMLGQGFWWLLMVLAITWANDTAAYFVGRQWGKHKLAPLISPNKTLEGSVAGLGAGFGIGLLMYSLIPALPGLDPAALTFWCLLTAAAGQAGDLIESALKRWAEVKDSGTIIPGHGGILDRFDSLLLAVPIAYLMLQRLL